MDIVAAINDNVLVFPVTDSPTKRQSTKNKNHYKTDFALNPNIQEETTHYRVVQCMHLSHHTYT